jgi:hypothetical protein
MMDWYLRGKGTESHVDLPLRGRTTKTVVNPGYVVHWTQSLRGLGSVSAIRIVLTFSRLCKARNTSTDLSLENVARPGR